jgi:hypothetical protein
MRALFTVLSVWASYNLFNILRSLYVRRTWASGSATIVAMEDRSSGFDGVHAHVKLLTLVHHFGDGERSFRVEPFRPPNAKIGDHMPIRFCAERPRRFHSENWLTAKIVVNVGGIIALTLIGLLAVILDMTR